MAMSAAAFSMFVLAISIFDVSCNFRDTLHPWVIESSDVEITPSNLEGISYLTIGETFSITISACIEDGVPAHLIAYLPVAATAYYLDPLVTVNDIFFTFIDNKSEFKNKVLFVDGLYINAMHADYSRDVEVDPSAISFWLLPEDFGISGSGSYGSGSGYSGYGSGLSGSGYSGSGRGRYYGYGSGGSGSRGSGSGGSGSEYSGSGGSGSGGSGSEGFGSGGGRGSGDRSMCFGIGINCTLNEVKEDQYSIDFHAILISPNGFRMQNFPIEVSWAPIVIIDFNAFFFTDYQATFGVVSAQH